MSEMPDPLLEIKSELTGVKMKRELDELQAENKRLNAENTQIKVLANLKFIQIDCVRENERLRERLRKMLFFIEEIAKASTCTHQYAICHQIYCTPGDWPAKARVIIQEIYRS